MSIFRPVLDQDLIARVLELKPKYMTATVFLNSMLEDAYKSRCKELKYMALYTHKDKELDKKGLEGKEQKEKFAKLEKLIIPLLVKLAKSPEAYIHWPNRAEVIESQLKKIVAITRG